MWSNQGGGGDKAGGYMTSPGNFSSPQGSQPQKANRQRSQNILPCTIAQVLQAEHVDDGFFSLGSEIHQVTIVGLVRAVKQTPTRMDYEIDDMTGPAIEVRKFNDSDENMEDMAQPIRENTYVRVCGHIRDFGGKRSLFAQKIFPLMDMNELTGHILETIKSNLILQKVKGQTSNPNTSVMGSTNQTASYSGANDPGLDGLTPAQKQVATAIRSVDSEQGVSIQEICQQLRGLPERAIRDAIDFLSGEGHIYSTIDDDHYRSTDAL